MGYTNGMGKIGKGSVKDLKTKKILYICKMNTCLVQSIH